MDFKLTPFKFRKIETDIPNNHKYILNVNEEKFLSGFPLGKYWTFDFIELISKYINFDEINTIFDLGSRDGHQSVEFRNWFPNSKIVLFEANPNQLNLIKSVTNNYNIEIVNKAVGNYNGETNFFISPHNEGASSLLKINNHKRSREWPQYEITVDIIRIDDWCHENNVNVIDILWMDVQGAEKLVLEGIGDLLYNVKAICTEVEISHMYHDSVLKDDLDIFLKKYGFVELQTYHMCPVENVTYDYLKENQGEVDVIYINSKYI